MHNNDKKWNARYEYTAVAMLALGFGLVGLDRFIILPLFPVMMNELQLDYQDLGNISAVLAIAWGSPRSSWAGSPTASAGARC